MRELERSSADITPARADLRSVGLVGRGRAAGAFERALLAAGYEIVGPVGRGEVPAADAILLCVPDAEIPAAAAAVAGASALVGHVSGATPLAALAASGAEGFGLHPLQTITGADSELAGAACAIGGTSQAALEAARELALALGMRPFEIEDEQRALYHAAASVASNFLVTLEAAAAELAAAAGVPDARAALRPLVEASARNWAERGPEALTGPIARGDQVTVDAQREAVAAVVPALLPTFDALVERTRALAGHGGPRMRVARTVDELRAALAARRGSVGLVPTMGAFHAGHLALMRAARAECDTVVVSLFVNPAQFGEGEDLAAYPRDEERDARLAAGAGVDVLFAPPPEEVYPPGFATTVSVAGLSDELEGESRGREHFDGVATVVAKLLGMARPDVAYFGQKDAQQLLVIERMVRDLDIPVRIVSLPTVRDADGLALSSRNAYLDGDERRRALALSRGLRAAERAFAGGARSRADVLAAASAELDAPGIEVDYIDLRRADDFAAADRVDGPTLLLIAARVGRARLIDNTILGGT